MSLKNTHLFAPVILNGFTKAVKGSMEYQLWWDEQYDRCINGYTVNGIRITGPYYFFLNFWKIRGINKKTKRKDYVNPDFLAMDFDFFNEWEKARENEQDFLVGKRRQTGFTEKEAALCGHNFTFFPSSQTVIACGIEKYGMEVYNRLLKGLNLLKKTEFGHRAMYEGDVYVAKHKVLLEEEDNVQWLFEGSFSEIHMRTCKNSDQALVGLSPDLIVWEESGLFNGRLIANYNYIKPALKTLDKKTGFCLFIGTGGEMSTGAEQLEELFFNPEVHNIRSYPDIYYEGYVPGNEDVVRKIAYFVPAWRFKCVDDDGNDDKDKALEIIHRDRKQALNQKGKNGYIIQITQFPLNPDEMFMRTGENGFNIEKLNQRLAFLRKHPELAHFWETGRLEWIRDNKGKITGVEFVPDPNGWIRIFEHPAWQREGSKAPQKFGLYKSATDSYDKNEALSSSSLGSMSIIKTFMSMSEPFANTYVARITCRPPTADEFYEMTAKACVYYYCYNLIEWSNIGIFGWYERNGFSHYLKERPRIAYANVKESKVNNRFGIDPNTKGFWITSYADYIEKYIDNMYDEEQIKRAIAYRDDPKYNCDITISSSIAYVHLLEDINLAPVDKEQKKEQFYYYQTNKQGQLTLTNHT